MQSAEVQEYSAPSNSSHLRRETDMALSLSRVSLSSTLVIIFLLLVPSPYPSCQARLLLGCITNTNVRLCNIPSSLSQVKPSPIITTFECKQDILACEEDCNSHSGCEFTCVDDVGFYCLCHCDSKIKPDPLDRLLVT